MSRRAVEADPEDPLRPPARAVPFPVFGLGYYPTPCPDEACGRPSTGGRPPRGWVRLEQAGGSGAVWACSFRCASRVAIRAELDGGDAPRP